MTVPTEQDELDRRLDEPRAESFRFKTAGDTIKGVVARLDVGQTAEYGSCKIVVVRTDDGQLRSIWLLHDALLSQMRKIKPRPGDRIAVRYLGRQQSTSTGRSYHAYTVVSDRDQAGAFDWDDEPAAGSDDEWLPPTEEPDGEPPF